MRPLPPLLLLLACAAAARAFEAARMDLVLGAYTLVVLYDAARPPPPKVMRVLTEGTTIYAVGVDAGISDSLVCRKVVTKQLVVSPRGCDARAPQDAVVDHFCEFGGDLALQSARQLTLEQWSLRADSPQCLDKAACFGPVYATAEGWTPDRLITDEVLLESNNGVFVVSGAGPAGEVPMATAVPVRMPRVDVTSTCLGFTDARFELTAKDNYDLAYVNATYTFGSVTDVVRRLRFERSSPGKFRLVLGYKGGSGGFYDDVFVSDSEFAGVPELLAAGSAAFGLYVPAPSAAPTLSPNWTPGPTAAPTLAPSLAPTLTRAPTLAPTLAPTRAPGSTPGPTAGPTAAPTLAPSAAPTAQCAASFLLVPAPRPFQLVEPEAANDLTYYLDRRDAYVTRECFLRRGAVDHLGNLVHPNCPRNALCGGRTRFRAPGPFGQKYRVEPHAKYRDFDWGCRRFWPRAPEFEVFRGGATVNRDAPELLACNAPFPHPQKIRDKDNDVYERLRQCRMLGGHGALESVSYCTIDVATTKCRRGWFFFDEFCYYRPDPDKDGQYRVRQEDADAACAALHPKARAATSIDEYTEAWLQTNFVFQNTASCGADPVRALVSGTRCKCYDCETNQIATYNATKLAAGGKEVYVGVVTECGCEQPVFPLCYYRIKDDYLAWNDEVFHPATLQVLRDGQCEVGPDGECMGNERYGKELECECFPGSAGQYCERRTCIANASTLLGEGLLLKFAQLCEKHGFCDEGRVDACQCAPGYGPPSVFGGDDFNDFPCGLPTTLRPRDPEGGFVVNGRLYPAPVGVCNGASAGEGLCDPTTKICRCECKTRKNLDPDGEPLEPAYDGVTCSARTPMLPANGFQINDGIVERLCNGRGTACPSGERLGERRLDGTYLVTVDSDKCRGKPDGCACDNGFAGHACTVPVPFDDAARKPTFEEFRAVVPVRGGRRPVMNVVVSPEAAYAGVVPTCNATRVFVSETALESEQECSRTREAGRWWCAGRAGAFVIVRTHEERPSCAVEVYTENHAPCGNHTNPFMGRFYANAAYRDWNRTDEFQSLRWSRHGGTTTECGCDADHTGKLCKTRVSGKRLSAAGEVVSHVCGEGTLPPRGRPTDEGCECNVVAGFDFGGSEGCACASVPGLGRCGGVGACLAPRMPLGRCEVDRIWEAEDPLSTPFSDVAPPEAARRSVYVVARRSVFEFEGRSWLLSEGQTLEIEALRGNASVCHDNAAYPLNVTHECGQPAGVPPPARAIANVTVVQFRFDCAYDECARVDEGNYTALCDPAFSCPTRRFCTGTPALDPVSPCLVVNEWLEDPDEGAVLPSKRYALSRATCAYLSPVSTQEQREFPYGVFPTCADPVYRWLDGALVGAGLVSERQCAGFGPHDNVKGQAFGLFDDVIPGLDFRARNWTRAHFEFLASLMNGQKCVDPASGFPLPDALNDAVVDAYAVSLVSVGAEEEVALGEPGSGAVLPTVWNASRLTSDAPAWWGNQYWHLGTALPFGPETRWGGWMYLPRGQGEVRKVTVRNGDPNGAVVTALAIVGPRGELCAARLAPLLPNETFTADCGAVFETEPLPVSLRRLWDQNRTNETAGLLAWPSPYVLLYSTASGPVEWREADVGYTSRATSYTERWRSISASIIGQRVFPYNAPYEQSCARQGGVLTPFDLDAADDRDHLRAVHGAHLAPAFCTHDWMCKRFSKDGANYRCVPDDSVPASCWANGDPAQCDALVGFEGGCEFSHVRPVMDPQFHGARCLDGYEATAQSVARFEVEARRRLENLTSEWTGHVLYNASQWPGDELWERCVFPSFSSTGRPTEACGGARGRLVRDAYSVARNLTLFDSNKYKRCAAVRLKSTGEELAAHAGETELDLHSFGGFRVNVLPGGRVFVDGAAAGAEDLECLEATRSETHRVRSTLAGGAPLIAKPRDFWTSFVL